MSIPFLVLLLVMTTFCFGAVIIYLGLCAVFGSIGPLSDAAACIVGIVGMACFVALVTTLLQPPPPIDCLPGPHSGPTNIET